MIREGLNGKYRVSNLNWILCCRVSVSYLYLAVLGLHCCLWAFSSCGGWGRLSCCCVRALGALSCSATCEIFLDQGLNSCPLHWQADSCFLFLSYLFILGCACSSLLWHAFSGCRERGLLFPEVPAPLIVVACRAEHRL